MKFLSTKVKNFLQADQLDQILTIFVFLYSFAIAFEIWRIHFTIVFNLKEFFAPGGGDLLSQLFFWALLVSIAVSTFFYRSRPQLFLVTAGLFLVVFRIYLMTVFFPERAYMPWNHAMIFWIFLALGLRRTLTDQKLIVLLKFYLLFSYFAAGVAKVRHGWEWMNGWTMQFNVLDRHMLLDTPLAWEIFKNLPRAQFLSWTVILLELSVPLVLIFRKLEWFYVFGFLFFQFLCWYTMKIYWMDFYGWSYLIYFSILVVSFARWFLWRRQRVKNSRSQIASDS